MNPNFLLFIFYTPLSPPPSPPARGQPARSFTLSDSALHPAGRSRYDVIWAKGCVNTALTLGMDLSGGAGQGNRERDCAGIESNMRRL